MDAVDQRDNIDQAPCKRNPSSDDEVEILLTTNKITKDSIELNSNSFQGRRRLVENDNLTVLCFKQANTRGVKLQRQLKQNVYRRLWAWPWPKDTPEAETKKALMDVSFNNTPPIPFFSNQECIRF